VGAAARPDARHLLLLVELVGPQPVGPDAGRVDHVGRGELELGLFLDVSHHRAGRAAGPLDEAGHLAAAGADCAEALRLAQHGEDEPGVVGLAVVEEVGGAGAAVGERGRQLERLGAVDDPVPGRAPGFVLVLAPTPGHDVVHVQPHARAAVGALAPEAGHEQR
jgi:hypothetical protein